jgi:hypothetical protein
MGHLNGWGEDMNNPEVTMHDAQQSTGFNALDKATTADRFRARASNEILPSRSPRVPPQTMFGPETRHIPGGYAIPKSV